VNIEASEMMGKLHDALKDPGMRAQLDGFLVRLVFCLFADDTGIFEPGTFLGAHSFSAPTRTEATLACGLSPAFRDIETPMGKRQHNLDADLAQFPT